MSKLPVVLLKKGEEGRLFMGHPWVFDNEIDKVPEGVEDGSLVTVNTAFGSYVGTGYINSKSKIRIRLMDIGEKKQKEKEVNIDKLLEYRVGEALKKRGAIKETNAMRLIFSEADMLPGFIADLYNTLLVIQITTLGMEKLKDKIIRLLDKLIEPEYIYEKSLSSIRLKEGLEPYEGIIKPEGGMAEDMVIKENGLKFLVDVQRGSKTGFYLDQRDNRTRIKRYSKNSKVLDAFCYTGAFSVYALSYGAKSALGIDTNEKALEIARENMVMNKFENYEFRNEDVFDAMRELNEAKEKFRLIILDPPPFSKAKGEKGGAKTGHKELHISALKIVEPGGHVFTFSCSRNISVNDLKKSVYSAAVDAKCKVRIIDVLRQSPDHPIVKEIKETEYLKGLIVRRLK